VHPDLALVGQRHFLLVRCYPLSPPCALRSGTQRARTSLDVTTGRLMLVCSKSRVACLVPVPPLYCFFMNRDYVLNSAGNTLDTAERLLGVEYDEVESHSSEEDAKITAISAVACAQFLQVIADVLNSQ
jgi:hypothetical protein